MPFALPAAATAMAAAAPAAAAAASSAALTSTLVSVASQVALNMAVSAVMSALSPQVGAAGRPVDWTLNPDGPIPFAFGRVGVAGSVVHKRTFGPDKMYYGFVSVLSGAGPIAGYNHFFADDFEVTFDGSGKAISSEWAGEMWRVSRLGAQPSTYLPTPTGLKNNAQMPDWGAGHVLSGKACTMLVMGENSKRSAYPNGEVKPLEDIAGLYAWDPRLDSTWPGGSGPCRLNDPSTWVWSQNPMICALKWALGLWEGPLGKGAPQVDQQVGGIGAKLSGIDVPALLAAANVADANSWYCGAYPSTDDDKHQVLSSFMQAAGATYTQRAGKISCIQRAAPRASVVTITADDVVGALEIDTAASRIDRINTIRPRYWSPEHRWQMTAIDEVTAEAYRTEDGGKRTRGIDYPYVTNATQAAQLAALDIANTREGIAGIVPLKPHLQRIRPGDAFTISEPGFVMDGVKCLCLNTDYDPATGIVSVTFVSETDAKYPFALGQSPTPPAPPVLTPSDTAVSPPDPLDWTVDVRPPAPGGGQVPGFDLTGVVSNATATAILVEWGLTLDPTDAGDWTQAYSGPPTVTTIPITGVQPGATYYIAVSYIRNQNTSARMVYGPYLAPPLVSDDTAGVGGTPAAELLAFFRELPRLIDDTDMSAEVLIREALDRQERVVAEEEARIAAVLAEEAARVEAILAEAAARGVAIAGVNTTVTTVATNLAAEITTRTEQYAATATSIALVVTQVTTAATALSAETSTRTTQIASLATSVAAVNTELTTTVTNLTALTTSTTTQFSAVNGTLASHTTSITTNASNLAAEVTTRTTQVSSLATSVASVNTAVNTVATDLTALTTSVTSQFSTVNGTLAGHTSSITTNASDLAAEVTTRTEQVASLATSISSVNTVVTSLVTADTVLATAVTTAQTTANGASSSATFALSALNGNEAYIAMLTDVNGRLTGQRINGATSAIDFLADYFNVTAGAGGGISYSAASKLFKIFDSTSKTVLKAGGDIRLWSGPSSVADGAETEENGVLAVGPGVVGGGRFNGVTLSGPFGADAPSGASTALTGTFATVGQGEKTVVNGFFFFHVGIEAYADGTADAEGFRAWKVDLQIVSTAWEGGDAEVLWSDSFGGSLGPGASPEWVGHVSPANLTVPLAGAKSGRRRILLQARRSSSATTATVRNGSYLGLYYA